MRDRADLLLLNATVLTLDRRPPTADAVAVRGDRIAAVGSYAELQPLISPHTEIVDAEGGVAIPGFHDAHMHLLAWARSARKVDCSSARSVREIRDLVAARVQSVPIGTWVEAVGYDELRLAERRHPDRRDLDAAVPDCPVRLRHRSLHLDVLNTRALELLPRCDGLLERDPLTGVPTGRLYDAGALLRGISGRGDVAADVRVACRKLASWGVTAVQDASAANDGETWDLFRRLSAAGDLGVRVTMMLGASSFWDLGARPDSPVLRRGPVKVSVGERSSDPSEVIALAAAARVAGHAVALHAVTEAELAIALSALGRPRPRGIAGPDRIEHGSVIPDDLLGDLRSIRATVVGNPGFVGARGDVYKREHAPEQRPWLHRAASLVRAGIAYAAGSDAPVGEPRPARILAAAITRRTESGDVLNPGEALRPRLALAALTTWPSRALGRGRELGVLRSGAYADVAVLDPDFLRSDGAPNEQARLTIAGGRVVWRRRTLSREGAAPAIEKGAL